MKLWPLISAFVLCFSFSAARAQVMFVAGRPAPIEAQYPWNDGGGTPLFRITTQRPHHVHLVSIPGTVTAVGADHYVIKTDAGKTYVAHFVATTPLIQRATEKPSAATPTGAVEELILQSSSIKVGDYLIVSGIDKGHTIRANRIMKLDRSGVQLVRRLRATYGKTWLMGSVVAVHNGKAKVQGLLDFQPETMAFSKNIDLEEGNGPMRLAALRRGDLIRADGTAIDGKFLATKISILGVPIAE